MNPRNPIAEFHDFVRRYIEGEKCHGENGLREPCDFVPREAITEFNWNARQITDAILLQSETATIPDTEQIRQNFAVVFSILVSLPTPKPQYIDLFMQHDDNDDKLPLQHPPVDQPPGESSKHSVAQVEIQRDIYEQFIEHQWKFCPFVLKRQHMRHLPLQRVLPIVRGRILEKKRKVVLQMVQIHRDCPKRSGETTADVAFNGTTSQKRPQNEGVLPITVVMKEFSSPNPEEFEREVQFYSQVQIDANPYIVNYYGSFIQNNKRVIVIEYGSGGNLLEFLEKQPSIRNHLDRVSFWKGLVGLLKGLEGITFLQPHNEHGRRPVWELRGSHQDIRPNNILVFRKEGSVGHRYQNIAFKFVDFGTSNVRTIRYMGLDQGCDDQGGNGMYSSPEATRDLERNATIQQKSDIWSLGAVMSETLVWSIEGHTGVQEYQDCRETGINASELEGGFHPQAFHDGYVRLSQVDETHQRLVQEDNCPITRSISSMILDYMLQGDWNNRWDAGRLHDHIIRRLPDDELHRTPEINDSIPWRGQDGLGVQPSYQVSNVRNFYAEQNDLGQENLRPDNLLASWRSTEQGAYSNWLDSHQNNNLPAVPQGGSAITVDTLYEFIVGKDNSTFKGKGRNTYAKVAKAYPTIDESLMTVRGAPGNRDQVFIIDNSESMKTHRRALAKTVRVLAWLLKGVGRNKIEMSFTSAAEIQIKEFSKSRPLEKSILHERFQGECHMGESLNHIFISTGRLRTDVAQRPLSVYILTNGKWQNDTDETHLSGVDEFVKDVINEVDGRGSRWVGFQFIRFFERGEQASHQVFKRRLKILDDDLPGMLQRRGVPPLQSDIVDTRDFDGDVGEMMRGIITQAGDDS